MTAAIKEMGIEFPALLAPLIYERDLFMVKQLRSLPPKYGSLESCYSHAYNLVFYLLQQFFLCSFPSPAKDMALAVAECWVYNV